MDKKKVVITGPIRNSEHSLSAHLTSVLDLDTEGLDIEYCYYTYNNKDNTLEILKQFKDTVDVSCTIVHEEIDLQRISIYKEHFWDDQSLLFMQAVRNHCVQMAAERKADYAYMVDSDVIMHPQSLKRLIEINNNGVSGSLLAKTFDKQEPQVNFGMMIIDDGHSNLAIPIGVFNDMPQRTSGFIEVAVMWGSWLIDKSAFNVLFSELKKNEAYVDAMEFKIFSKNCRHLGISQRIDLKYPGIHLERSFFPVIPWQYFQGFPKEGGISGELVCGACKTSHSPEDPCPQVADYTGWKDIFEVT